jgi:hypothetical protein
MDIRMPVMDGKEAIRRIRIMPGGQQVKIIALTAHALDTERQEILAAGCDAFIRKPFSDTEIFQALSSHLGAAFTYKVMGSPQPNAGAAGSYADSLRALPGGLLNQLAEAAEKLDSQLCYEAADRIAPLDSELAGYLAGLVDRLQFPEILALVDPIIMKGEFHA